MVTFRFHTPENTTGSTQELLSTIKKQYGFFPNLFGPMAESPVTVEAYLALNDFVSKTSFTPGQQQIALLEVSVENNCEFCSIAHRAIGKIKGASVQTLSEIATYKVISDPQDRALASFVQTVTKNRGRPAEAEVQAFLEAGFSIQQIFEVILIVSIKTLSNYANHLTHPEPNKELFGML